MLKLKKKLKFLVHSKDMKNVCYLCLLALLIPISSSFQSIALRGMWLLTETTTASLILIFGQLGRLYSLSSVGNSFLEKKKPTSFVLNCLLHSCKSARGETCGHWQRQTLCFTSHCHFLACIAGHHYQERLVWISRCYSVTVIAHLQIQHSWLNVIIIMKKKSNIK